jgi:hypothetical protein
MRRTITILTAAVALAAASAPAGAGTGVYDMTGMVAAPHPFAATPGRACARRGGTDPAGGRRDRAL